MIGGGQTGTQVLRIVEDWVPKKAYRKEVRFRDDLMEYLDASLHSGGGFFSNSRAYSIRKERGRSRADIAVDDEVGIELKRAITNNKLRRLRDQLHDYMEEYPFTIICACGVKETGKWNELRQEYEGQRGGFGLGQSTTVRFVTKEKDGRTFSGQSSTDTGGGFLGGGFDVGFDDDLGGGIF